MVHKAVVVGLLLCSAVLGEEKYSAKYDDVNVDEILANDRQRETYYRCFAGMGPCVTADARFFKESLPEAIVTQCRKCTEKQSRNFDKLTNWYTDNQPDKYHALLAKVVRDTMRKST